MKKKQFRKALIHVLILYILDAPNYQEVMQEMRSSCTKRQQKRLQATIHQAITVMNTPELLNYRAWQRSKHAF